MLNPMAELFMCVSQEMNGRALSASSFRSRKAWTSASGIREFVESRPEPPVTHRSGVFPFLDAGRQRCDALRISGLADFQQGPLLVRCAQSRPDGGLGAAPLVVDVGNDGAHGIQLSVEVVPLGVALRELALQDAVGHIHLRIGATPRLIGPPDHPRALQNLLLVDLRPLRIQVRHEVPQLMLSRGRLENLRLEVGYRAVSSNAKHPSSDE